MSSGSRTWVLMPWKLFCMDLKRWEPILLRISEEENLVNVYKEKDSPLLQEIKPILTINLLGAVCKKGGTGRGFDDCCSLDEETLFTIITRGEEKEEEFFFCTQHQQDRDETVLLLNKSISQLKPEVSLHPDMHKIESSPCLPSSTPDLELGWEDHISRSISPDLDMLEFDYDLMYSEINPLTCNKEKNSSVIGSVVAQLLKTMNPSRVRLPTCVLECRSLLESYADGFGATKYFTSIGLEQDGSARLLAVLRFYISTLKCTRPIDSPCKPYNPILGEFFTCSWQIHGGSEENDQVKFFAEQVSHHPPVTASYAEHSNTRVTYTSLIHTKSGLRKTWKPPFLESLLVEHVGEASLKVLEYNEEYIMTFPNAVVFSVLRSPQLMLEGTVKINCVETGFSAELTFSDKFQVKGRTRGLDQDISFNGLWNKVIYIQNEDKGLAPVPLISMESWTGPELHKVVAPLATQKLNESRRLWRHVTRALAGYPSGLAGDEAKYQIEVAARKRSQEMAAQKTTWKPEFFQGDLNSRMMFKFEMK